MDKPIKVLHIGNIAQNGYLNAKFLRRYRIEADLLIYDYGHAPGYPEWEDAVIENYWDIQEFNPIWEDQKKFLKITNGFERPSWFIEVQHYRPTVEQKDNKFRKQRHFMRRALMRKFFGPLSLFFTTKSFDNDSHFLDKIKTLTKKIFSITSWQNVIRNKIKIFAVLLKKTISFFWGKTAFVREEKRINREYFSYIDKKNLLPSESLHAKGFFEKRIKNFGVYYMFKTFGEEFLPLFEKYDIIQAYHWDPALVIMSGINKPLISFEHSTLRRTPLENNMLGRLMGIAYHRSKKVIITNTDTVKTAETIGLKNYTFIPHPLDTKKFKPEETPLKKQLKEKYNADIIIFYPTRQNRSWKGNDKVYPAMQEFLKTTNKKVKFILCNWGEEKDWAKKYLKELNIDKYIEWLPILPKMTLKEYYNAADIVIDQFSEGVMGTIAPEGMACGKPVIMHYDHEINKWAFPEKPPIVQANNPEEICNALKSLAENESLRKEIGKKGREWVEKYHSWKITTEKLIGVYEEVLGKKIQ